MPILENISMENIKSYILHEQLLVPKTEQKPRSGEGAAILLPGGVIYLVYCDFQGPHDHSRADIVKVISKDQGRNWSEPEILQSCVEGQNVMSPGLLRLDNGNIAFSFMQKTNDGNCLPFFRTSYDDAGTWTEPQLMISQPGYYVVNNDRLCQTSSGRIILPYAYSPNVGLVEKSECGVIYSDDYGKNWTPGKQQIKINRENVRTPLSLADNSGNIWRQTLDAGIFCQEPGVIERDDGSLLMWARTNGAYMYMAVSNDGSDTWSDFQAAPDIISPVSPQSIKKIPGTGRMLCVYNDHSDFRYGETEWNWRTPLSLAVSDDGGRSWRRIGDLESDRSHSYCYTSILFLEDSVFFTYYQSVECEKDGQMLRRNLASLKIKCVHMDLFK